MTNTTGTAFSLVLALLPGIAHGSDLFTQNLTLTPGWNAVFLEVQPEPSDPLTVFEGVPVDSAWTWSERRSAAQFLVDPEELEWNQSGWLGYRSSPTEAMLTDLYSLVANRAYLIKLNGSEPVTWSVTGRPSRMPIRWVANSFNLIGFHVDPALSVSLGELLAPSEAHAGQAVYSLSEVTRKWEFVNDPFTVAVKSGEAYWVYCSGASTYQGPWSVDVATAGLDFGASLSRRLVRFTNHSDQQRTVSIRELGSTNPERLAFKSFDAAAGVFEWNPLSGLSTLTLPPGETVPLTLAVRREALTAAVGSILELTDGQGQRLLIPVRATK